MNEENVLDYIGQFVVFDVTQITILIIGLCIILFIILKWKTLIKIFRILKLLYKLKRGRLF